MSTPRPTGRRFRAEAIPLALAALLLASLPLAAQQRSRPSHSSDHGRTAHEVGSRSPAPSSPSTSGSRSSTSGDSPRTAHGVPGTPSADRQPPHDRGGRGSHGGRGGGHFFYGGGYYWPPYWDSYYYPYYGRWGWGLWWGPDYDPYYYPRGYYDRYDRDEMGALDLDVSPGRTEVYVNGQRLGTVDDYDGWPRYLWLPRGTYDVVFYLDGFQTIARQITIYPGSVLDIDDRMEPGASKRPEELATKTHERRDERIGYERERSRRIDEEQGEDQDWRDRAPRDRGDRGDRSYRRHDRDDDHDRSMAEGREDEAPRGDRGRLVLDVEPEDSSVYVDGRFVGTGADLSHMRSGLPLTPGEHKLAVVRPGHKSEEKDFTVKAGEKVEVDVTLEESGPGR
jgi:PEGA domain-containing protein